MPHLMGSDKVETAATGMISVWGVPYRNPCPALAPQTLIRTCMPQVVTAGMMRISHVTWCKTCFMLCQVFRCPPFLQLSTLFPTLFLVHGDNLARGKPWNEDIHSLHVLRNGLSPASYRESILPGDRNLPT